MAKAKGNRGQWQAQGSDIGGSGHRRFWNEAKPPTKADALQHLSEISAACAARQRSLRVKACNKAKRFVARAPRAGIEGRFSKSFEVSSRRTSEKGARIDLEITVGFALCG